MKKVVYPFVDSGKGKIRPFIPVVLINPDNGMQIKVTALLDTGADSCAFPRFTCDQTGHNLNGNGVECSVNGGVGGVPVNTWKHSFCIGILDPTGKKILYMSNRILVCCFEHNNAPPLLGGNDFMINFQVSFNYPKKEITISWE